MKVLCLVEREGDGFADGSLRALSFASSLAVASGAGLVAVLFPDSGSGAALDGEATVGQLAVLGATEACLVSATGLTGYAPAAWARALQQLAASGEACAVVAAATDRGSEVLAHLGAMAGLPVAANCVSARPGSPGSWQLVRQRWAGSLLEDAVLEAPCALLSVAADALPAPDASRVDSMVLLDSSQHEGCYLQLV